MPKRVPQEERSNFTTFGFDTWMGHPPPMAWPHRHNEIELNYLWEGRATYLAGSRLLHLPQRRLCVFWGTVPHHIVELDRECRLSWLTLPLPWVLRWGLPRKFIERLLSGDWILDREESALDKALLPQWLSDHERKRAAWKEVVALEVEARLRRMALKAASDNAEFVVHDAEGAMAVVEQVARYVAENYRQPLRAADIARTLGRHPNYLMQAFKQRCGITIGEYVLHMRLSHTQRLLATTDRKVADVAMEAGFSSLNTFYEAFGKVIGVPPGEYRKVNRGLSQRARYLG